MLEFVAIALVGICGARAWHGGLWLFSDRRQDPAPLVRSCCIGLAAGGGHRLSWETLVALDRVGIPESSNEITAGHTLPRLIDLTGMLVTGDAIHSLVETVLFALKANGPPCCRGHYSFATPQGAFETLSAMTAPALFVACILCLPCSAQLAYSLRGHWCIGHRPA
jgi:hypothetical protein